MERTVRVKMKKSEGKSALLFTFIFIIPLLLNAQSVHKKVAEANKLFHEQKYDRAINKYQDALLEDPTSPLIQFNMGDVLYKKKSYEKALKAYQKALDSRDPMLQSKAYYNIGNTLYRAGKLPESIIAYQQALKLNPDDQDAKYNLEFVRNKLKQNPKKQQQQQNQQKQQREESDKKNRPDNKRQDQNKEQNDQKQEQRSAEQKRKEMSKEEAENLLNALKENQKKMKKKLARAGGKIRVLKDW